MKIFYHNDMDGHCSGAIIRGTAVVSDNADYIEISYNENFPYDIIEKDEDVFIVDYSPDDFERLLRITKNVIWIDHHKTAIEKWEYLNLKGIRKIGTAACCLTWSYFYPNLEHPTIVKLVGDYDLFEFKFGEDTNIIQSALRLYNTKATSYIWRRWLDVKYDISDLRKEGKIALKSRNNYYRSVVKHQAFLTTIHGYTAIACNIPSASSQIFDFVDGVDFDVKIIFSYNGDVWTVNIYTQKDIDVSEIAKKYGGGGHKQAAGFSCKELPFKKEKGLKNE